MYNFGSPRVGNRRFAEVYNAVIILFILSSQISPYVWYYEDTHIYQCDIFCVVISVWYVFEQKIKDSWRIVNHRDIIPTVPRLMGYCHVAEPVYLATGNVKDALVRIYSVLLIKNWFMPVQNFNIVYTTLQNDKYFSQKIVSVAHLCK